MAFLTSYLFKNVELNDGINYAVPLADQGLDDLNSVDATWAYRKGAVPMQTQLTIKEGVFNLNINILPQATAAAWEAKLTQLKQIFDTRDPVAYAFYRKLPHEQSYRYLLVSPREFVVNRLERKVVVTLQTADKSWADATEHDSQITLFEGAPRDETLTITYDGLTAYEPTITIKAVSPGSDGPQPLYYREVALYSVGSGGAGYIVGNPVLLVSGWNTNAEVGAGKMRSDGLDITVTLPDGSQVPRYIGGTQASRKVWIKPTSWPAYVNGCAIYGPGAGDTVNGYALTDTDTVLYLNIYGYDSWTATGKVMLDSEVIAYSAVAPISVENGTVTLKLTLSGRGQDGTSAADHTLYTPVKRPVVLKVGYGYAGGYAQTIYNNLNGWPLINYETSSNSLWVQDDTYDPNPTNRPWVWRGERDPAPLRTWESVVAKPETQTRLALYGTYVAGAANSTLHERLILPVPGYSSRTLDYIRLSLTLKGGAGTYPAITVRLMKLRRGYGTGSEECKELWSYTHSSGAEAVIDTGWVFTDQRWWPGTHYFLRLDGAAPGTEVRNLRIDQFQMQLDIDYWAYYPIAGALGSEKGVGTGEYPVTLDIQNLDDAGNPQVFRVYTRMSNDQEVTIDCANRTATGMLLNECTYYNPIWLRLVPGTNRIKFTGTTGAGQMLATITWKDRY